MATFSPCSFCVWIKTLLLMMITCWENLHEKMGWEGGRKAVYAAGKLHTCIAMHRKFNDTKMNTYCFSGGTLTLELCVQTFEYNKFYFAQIEPVYCIRMAYVHVQSYFHQLYDECVSKYIAMVFALCWQFGIHKYVFKVLHLSVRVAGATYTYSAT